MSIVVSTTGGRSLRSDHRLPYVTPPASEGRDDSVLARLRNGLRADLGAIEQVSFAQQVAHLLYSDIRIDDTHMHHRPPIPRAGVDNRTDAALLDLDFERMALMQFVRRG